MLARYIPTVDLEVLLDPGSRPWKGVGSTKVALIGTPLGLQPTPAIQVAWAKRKIGAVDHVGVSALHDGRTMAFRLEWSDATENGALEDNTSFVDAAGILLASSPQAPMPTMGAPGQAVNAWYWRADENDRGRQVVAEGVGTTRTVDTELVRGRGIWKGGRWQVVITRPLLVQTSEPVAQLQAGKSVKFGVAIWEGSNGERAGIKAFSVDWRALDLAAVPSVRR